MMIGERNYPYPTFHVPPCITIDDSATEIPYSYDMISNGDDCSPFEAVTALHRFLPSNDVGLDSDDLELYSSDHFRMFEFKVRKCTRGRSHDWTECPYAHPGEKARRRDPRKYHYSGTSCPDFRKGNCKKGDACEYAHGVFECWLHPARYRTQPCKDGPDCGRRVCFFAHSPDQLRVLSPRTPDSLESNGCSGAMRFSFMSSPESVSPPSESPPMSPMVNSVAASLRQLQLNKVKSMPSSWTGVQLSPNGYGPPRLGMTPPGFFSSPSTPTGAPGRIGIRPFDLCEEGPMMERVESGRDLRAKMFEKLSRENPLDRVDPDPQSACPDVKWVSDLLK